ncbi:hypothetical protein HNY73_017329 [Argiope bruennichi]|uniref:Uncharacterized protein n=1 Tax=Argiope bruennichi TaxID=94029 RepID=A0A8T0EQ89_ARGBR|nr:hypothetical protein HNY73_017329 [Argiope bruennichi]
MKITAWTLRFVRNCKKVTQHTSQNLEIEDPVICDEGECHNPSDSSSPAPVPVSPEELLPTSQPQRINRYGRTLRAPHRLDL